VKITFSKYNQFKHARNRETQRKEERRWHRQGQRRVKLSNRLESMSQLGLSWVRTRLG